MKRLAALLLLITPAAARADPVPYGFAPPPGNWREQAAQWLGAGTLGPDANIALQLNNYWGMRQDQRRPWKGTPRGDGYNGASQAGEAVFSDARWSARAIAIELRDDVRAGARTPKALGEALAAACLVGSSPAACPGADAYAEAIAQGAKARRDQSVELFTAAGDVGPALRPVMRALARREVGPDLIPSDALIEAGVDAVRYDGLDQGHEAYGRWRELPGNAPAAARFESYLQGQGLGSVLPAWQMLRTASDWKGCGAPFAVPPEELWPHIAATLRLVQDKVKPAVPGLEARSSYRGPWLNVCTGGAERSAHREFWALDLTPTISITRNELMGRLCPIYAGVGTERSMALGFYGGTRFHIDTSSHRQWATWNKHPYGPCAADGSVNPPPDLPPPPEPWPTPPAPR